MVLMRTTTATHSKDWTAQNIKSAASELSLAVAVTSAEESGATTEAAAVSERSVRAIGKMISPDRGSARRARDQGGLTAEKRTGA